MGKHTTTQKRMVPFIQRNDKVTDEMIDNDFQQ